ncbi:carbohydrate transmembrane transporter [Aureococcus anophagefferens]|nr:carbohydrate transmembrane transporter [Aureococcus anophagefferens]
MSVPCINFIGMSLGLLIWGATNMVVGWASGRYGLFGLDKDAIANPALNYVGVALVLVCLGLFTRVETKTRADLLREADGSLDETLLVDEAGDAKVVEKPGLFGVGTNARRTAGIAMAVVSGVFYGSNFDPPHHFTGILLTSSFYFAAYCAFKVCRGDAPDVRRELVGPAFLSGLIWGLSDICWFVANEALSFSVSFPLVTSGPGFVAAAWGIFVYGEIAGAANFRVLGLAFVILVVACALIVVSKN